MPTIDFVIGNPGHHLAAARPVARRLVRRSGFRCRIVSLCEFRGFVTPTDSLTAEGLETIKLVPFRFRSPSTLRPRAGNGARPSATRRLAHGLGWRLLLRPRLGGSESPGSDLVVLPNDSAFPYDRISRHLRGRGVPFLLLQEGIRFPLPATGDEAAYGTGGAAAIAAWGETSAEYFRAQGVEEERIFVTGSPRLETALARDWTREADRVRERLNLDGRLLLYLSNPIDDQGYCSTAEKLGLFAHFVDGLAPLLEKERLRLVVKLHGREDEAPFAAAAARRAAPGCVAIVRDAPLYPLLRLASAAVILTSTAGLEALACGLPLGVLPLPGHGFAADYVSSGAALGLDWRQPLAGQIESLLTGDESRREAAERYLRRSLAHTGDASDQLQNLIEGLVS